MSTDFLSYLNILNPRLLQEEESVTVALEVLEGTVDAATAEAIVRRAAELPHALEYILSGMLLLSFSD